MAFFDVEIKKISELNPIEGADFVELGKVEGMAFQFVVKKGEFKIGDEVVYFPIDSVLPQDLIEFYGISKFLTGKEHNRVKTTKFKGQYSQGFVAPARSIEEYTNGLLPSNGVGNLAEALGVTKYEQPAIMESNAKLVRLPSFVSAYDIEGADRYTMVTDFMMDKPVFITEKLEGMNFGVSIDENDKVVVNQRNYAIEPHEGKDHSFWKVAEGMGLIEGVKKIKKLVPEIQTVTIRGEFVGGGSQGDYYDLKVQKVYIFEIELNGGSISAKHFIDTLTEIGLQELIVPVLSVNVTLKDWLDGKTVQEASNGISLLNKNKKREGIVIKLMEEDRTTKLDGFSGRLFIKQRSPQYLAKTDN